MPDIREVGPLETAAQQQALAEGKLVHDVLRHARGCRGRQRDHGDVERFTQLIDGQVVRTEVVAPLRDAVRFVHDDIVDRQQRQPGLEQRRTQPLGRYVEELEIAVGGIVQRQLHLAPLHARMNGQRADTPVFEVLHLVLHQRDQGRDYQRDTLLHQGRHLEADGLAAARGQDGQHVPAVRRGGDDLLLHRTEGIIAPILLQYFQCFHLCKCKEKLLYLPDSKETKLYNLKT